MGSELAQIDVSPRKGMSSAALPNSVLGDVLAEFPGLRSQIYFKNSLTALSHAMEDLVLSGAEDEQPIVVACFQKERFYRQEAKRYERIGRKSPHVFVLASPETDLIASPSNHEAIPFTPDDALANECPLVGPEVRRVGKGGRSRWSPFH